MKLTVFLRDTGHLETYRKARNHFFATVTPTRCARRHAGRNVPDELRPASNEAAIL